MRYCSVLVNDLQKHIFGIRKQQAVAFEQDFLLVMAPRNWTSFTEGTSGKRTRTVKRAMAVAARARRPPLRWCHGLSLRPIQSKMRGGNPTPTHKKNRGMGALGKVLPPNNMCVRKLRQVFATFVASWVRKGQVNTPYN